MILLFVSIVIAVLSAMGVGGGGLMVIYLTLISGYSISDARAVNLLFFIVSAGVALVYHKTHRAVLWRYVAVLVSVAVPGVMIGTYLATVMDPTLTRHIFGWFLIVSGGMYFYGKLSGKYQKRSKT